MPDALTVHIVESPSPEDFYVDRAEGRVLRGALEHAGVEAKLRTVVNRDYLQGALGAIYDHHHDGKGVPVLHVSMHGTKAGIRLTSSEEVKWEELGYSLAGLNCALDQRLVVVMSTCHGFSAVKTIMQDHVPFNLLVGADDDISWPDTVAVFVAFYHHLHRGGTIEKGVEIMNAILGWPKFYAANGEKMNSVWKMISSAVKEVRRSSLP